MPLQYSAEQPVQQEASIQFAYVGATMDSKSGSPIKHDKIKLNPHVFQLQSQIPVN